MEIVLLTALGVGGATVIGAVLGFALKEISHRFSDIVLSLAAGVMLAAAVIGLILPSLEYGGKSGLPGTVVGIFCGALCLNLMDKAVPHLHRLTGVDQEAHPAGTEQLDKVLLFVMAIAIHNLPEGVAAGVGFGTGNTGEAMTIAAGIADLARVREDSLCADPFCGSGTLLIEAALRARNIAPGLLRSFAGESFRLFEEGFRAEKQAALDARRQTPKMTLPRRL